MDAQEPVDVDARLKLMSVVWLALSTGVFAAGSVVYGLQTVGGVDLASLPPSILTFAVPGFLAIMVVGLFVGAGLERRIPAGAGSDDKAQAYFSARVVAMSMQEAPTLALIVLSLLTGTPILAAAATVVGVWTTFLTRPRREDLERLLRA